MEIEKLTIKHLAPYLPYGLELMCYHNDNIVEPRKVQMVAIDTEEHFGYSNNEPTAYIYRDYVKNTIMQEGTMDC